MSDIQSRLSDLKAKHEAEHGKRMHAIASAITLIGVLALVGIAAQVGMQRQHQIDLAQQEQTHG